MTLEEYISKKDALRLKLEVVMASAVPSRVKTARIHAITREIVALKHEVVTTIASYEPRP